MLFTHPTLSESDIKLLASASQQAYSNQANLNGWTAITPELISYGLNSEFIVEDTFTRNAPDGGDANATVFKSGDNLIISFRGTREEGDSNYWTRFPDFYNLFEPLFQAFDQYTKANSVSRILVTGHSLGAAMTELFMAEHPELIYSAVSLASPIASNDPSDTRILNIGYENDTVYEVVHEAGNLGLEEYAGYSSEGANPNNSTTNFYIAVGAEHQSSVEIPMINVGIAIPILSNHAMDNYIYGINRVFDSTYYSQTKKDSLVIIDLTDSEITEITSIIDNSTTKNALILGEDDDNDVIYGINGNDIIEGLGGDDRLIGESPQYSYSDGGDDTLDGGAGNDLLDGRKGEDVAIFSDDFENYDYEISESIFGGYDSITFTHPEDGIDELKNIEFAQFQDTLVETAQLESVSPETVSRIIPLPLEDGIANTVSEQVYVEPPVNFTPDPVTPPHVSLTAPISMLDGDIDYSLNISPYKPDTQYNISYILDTSGSMDAEELQTAKDAYIDLINYYIDTGVAENSNFSVISFSRFANPYFNLTAEQAISIIQSLTTAPTSEGTKYNDALHQGLNFLSQSPLDLLNTSNIAYFVTDGKSQTNFFDPSDVSYHQDAQNLRRFSHVQAFGINEEPNEPGAVTSGQLNFVDSNDGVLVSDIANLSDELNKSGLATDVSEVKILVDGEVVETIPANQLTDSPLGLTYEGSIENLDVSIDAENVITAEVVFNNDLPTTTVDYTVTAGEGETTDSNGNPIDEEANPDPLERMRNGGDDDDTITLGYPDLGANGGAGGDYIVGNNRDNLLNGDAGSDTIYGHGGNDTITPGSGSDRLDGGADIDTVVYDDVVYQGNENNIYLRRVGNILSYNNTDSLTDVEFIQFADVRISTQTLEITPTIEVREINTIEGSPASFNFELAYAAPVDIVFDYSTADGDAVAGLDYTATSGQVTIPAGETTATVEVETLEDTIYDENTETFILNLTGLTGATFANNETELGVPVYIENQEAAMTLVGDGEANFLTGGNNDDLIQGKDGNDILNGGDGDDTLVGEAGDDTLDGGTGSDRFFVFSNHNITLTDTQVTGDGTDAIALLEYAHLTGDNQSNIIDATSATEISTLVKGNGGYDTLRGGDKNDTILGGYGNDVLIGNGGDDILNGQGGSDRIFVTSDNDLTLTDTQVTGDGTDTIISIEDANLYGGDGANVIDATNALDIKTFIKGNGGNDTLYGGAQNDAFQGNAGNDILVGNGGNDTLIGGVGSDHS